ALEPPRHVVIAGHPHASDFRALAGVMHEKLGYRRSILAADGASGQAWLTQRAPWIAAMKPGDGRATAYVCEEFSCQAPVSDPELLRALLRQQAR
ncbi:MAG: thioredoxin domain-containing protein, partial [Opitutaceae bacterium]